MMWNSRARFSAVIPMRRLQTGSVSPTKRPMMGLKKRGRRLSSVFSFWTGVLLFIRDSKKCMASLLYNSGMLLMDSTPPARIMLCSPRVIRLAPVVMASIPEAQFRWTVRAEVCLGIPAFRAMTRATFAAWAGWAQFPIITSSMSFGFVAVLARISRTGMAASSSASRDFSVVATLAIGVRIPSMMAILSLNCICLLPLLDPLVWVYFTLFFGSVFKYMFGFRRGLLWGISGFCHREPFFLCYVFLSLFFLETRRGLFVFLDSNVYRLFYLRGVV